MIWKKIIAKQLISHHKKRTEDAKKKLSKLSIDEAKVRLDLKAVNIKEKWDHNLHLNPEDEGISTDLYAWRYREPLYINMLYNFLKKENDNIDCVADIGSNIGYFPFLELISTTKKILAIEPVSETFQLLKKNVERFKNVTAINIAISNKKEELQIHIPNQANLATMLVDNLKFDPGMFVKKIENVQALSIKDLVESYGLQNSNIVLRMDVEGFEEKILREIPKEVYGITYELHPRFAGDEVPADLLERIIGNGFRLWGAAQSQLVGVVVLTRYMGLSRAVKLFKRMTNKQQIFLEEDLKDLKTVRKLVIEGQCTHMFLVRER